MANDTENLGKLPHKASIAITLATWTATITVDAGMSKEEAEVALYLYHNTILTLAKIMKEYTDDPKIREEMEKMMQQQSSTGKEPKQKHRWFGKYKGYG